MVRRLGEQFFHVAVSPVTMAGHCLRRGDVQQGLAELSGESLVGSVQRAVDAIAAKVELPVAAVEQLLPAEEMDALLEQVSAAQLEAEAQWKLHMAHAGGLLEAVAKLTADGRPPEAGLCLMRIATKMKLEADLAAPLRELAARIDEWQEMLARVRDRIEQGKELERAQLRLKRRRIILACVGAAGLIGLLAATLEVVRTRRRLDAVLSRPDPCEVEAIRGSDLSLASGAQRKLLEQQMRSCLSVRQEARLALERAKADEERRKREEEQRQAREAVCKDLGVRLAAPSNQPLPPKMVSVLGGDAEFLERLAQGRISPEDVTRDVTGLACLDGEAGEAVANAFAAALVRSTEDWIRTQLPSESALALAVRGRAAIDEASRRTLILRTEEVALSGLTARNRELLELSGKKCAMVKALGLEPRMFCSQVKDKLGN